MNIPGFSDPKGDSLQRSIENLRKIKVDVQIDPLSFLKDKFSVESLKILEINLSEAMIKTLQFISEEETKKLEKEIDTTSGLTRKIILKEILQSKDISRTDGFFLYLKEGKIPSVSKEYFENFKPDFNDLSFDSIDLAWKAYLYNGFKETKIFKSTLFGQMKTFSVEIKDSSNQDLDEEYDKIINSSELKDMNMSLSIFLFPLEIRRKVLEKILDGGEKDQTFWDKKFYLLSKEKVVEYIKDFINTFQESKEELDITECKFFLSSFKRDTLGFIKYFYKEKLPDWYKNFKNYIEKEIEPVILKTLLNQ